MENKFKYRPEIKSIEDLQPGDEFLVGDGRIRFIDECYAMHGESALVGVFMHNVTLAHEFIRANVPIERNIPYPEGGAEKWELREIYVPSFDWGRLEDKRTLFWCRNEWISAHETWRAPLPVNGIYAIPKAKPQDKAQPQGKAYLVHSRGHFPGYGSMLCVDLPNDDFKPGDRVTVQRVEK
jgi:hypothetical protein